MAETKMQLADWLDDLCVRFIVNLPQEELLSAERICFQIEEAQWFYEDFIRPLNPALPSMSLRTFCMCIFQVCPMLCSYSPEIYTNAYSQFLAYKTRVPVRGAILLNEKLDQVILVKGWKKGASWSFPRGKINKDERDLDCALREVYEETGYDLAAAGLIPNDEEEVKSIEVTMREQHMKLYVFRDVPMDTAFQARTRKEISKITWWKLAQIPGYQKKKNKQNNSNAEDSGDAVKANKLYMVAPFLPQLKKWITQERRNDQHRRNVSDAYLSTGDVQATDADMLLEDDMPEIPVTKGIPTASNNAMQQPSAMASQPNSNLTGDPSAEAAAQMKRLLGVSDALPNAPEPTGPAQPLAQHQVNLLGMLRSKGGPQMSMQPTHAQQSTMPPAQNVAYPAPSQPLPHYQQPPANDLFQGPGSSQMPFLGPRPSGSTQTPIAQTQLPLPDPHRQQAPRLSAMPVTSSSIAEFNAQNPSGRGMAPYQRTGDPSFARPDAPAAQHPPIPRASELPAPKMTNQAMTLLNMFKGSAKDGAKSPAVPAPASTTRPNAGATDVLPPAPELPLSNPTPTAQRAMSQPRRPSARNIFGGLVPSTVSPVSAAGRPKPATPARKHSEMENNQAQLLNLFKAKPAETEPVAVPSTIGQVPGTDTTPAPTASTSQDQSAALLALFNKPTGKATPPTYQSRATPSSIKPAAQDGGPQSLLQLLKSPRDGSNAATSPAPEAPIARSKVEVAQLKQPSAQLQHSRQPMQPTEPKTIAAKAIPDTAPLAPQQSLGKASNKSQQPKVQVEQGTEHASPKPTRSDQQATPRRKKHTTQTALQKAEKETKQAAPATPVQILKRPTSGNANSPAQPSSAAASPAPVPTGLASKPARSPRAGLQHEPAPVAPKADSQSGKKPFAPQILRRPQSSGAPHADTAKHTVQTPEERQTSNRDDQQRALLSLLSGSKRDGPSSSSSVAARKLSSGTGHESPVESVPPSPGAKMELSRSRISSIASPPSGEAPPRSRLNSAASVPRAGTPLRGSRGGGGSQTPMSPADKGFLVNYLEGVIGKGSSTGK